MATLKHMLRIDHDYQNRTTGVIVTPHELTADGIVVWYAWVDSPHAEDATLTGHALRRRLLPVERFLEQHEYLGPVYLPPLRRVE